MVLIWIIGLLLILNMKKEKAILYNKCNILTMDLFIECLVNKNYKVLIKEGKTSSARLRKTWILIWSEFLELQNSDSYIMILDALKDYHKWRSIISACEVELYVLKIGYTKDAAEVLRRAGIDANYETEDKEEYIKILQVTGERIKALQMKVMTAEQNYRNLTEETMQKELTEMDFEDIFVQISKFMGYNVRTKDLTVSEYIAILRTMKKG